MRLGCYSWNRQGSVPSRSGTAPAFLRQGIAGTGAPRGAERSVPKHRKTVSVAEPTEHEQESVLVHTSCLGLFSRTGVPEYQTLNLPLESLGGVLCALWPPLDT